MHINMPADVRMILDTLRQGGYEAYIVGGCVRDALLHRTPGDWDITTNALPHVVRKLFRRTIPTGIAHGTVTVLCGGGRERSYEVTTYRVDGIYEDARHPKEVTFTGSLEEDLQRRDFTINAMAYNDEQGLVDLYAGMQDLEAGIIRCVGNPVERFTEDALRMLRAFRFAAQLDFAIDQETGEAAIQLAPSLKKISAERIREELLKLLCSPHPEVIRQLYETGLTAVFLPEFDRCMETNQNSPYHYLSVGEHTIAALCAVPPKPVLRQTMLLHDIAKPETKTTEPDGRDHFYGHAKKSAERAKEILRRLKSDNKTIQTVSNLIAHHDLRLEGIHQAAWVRRLMNRVGREAFPLLLMVMEADNAAKAPEKQEELKVQTQTLRSLYEQIVRNQDAVALKELAVTGSDLIALGMDPGKEIGQVLERMLQDVLGEPAHNDRAYLLQPSQIRHYLSMESKAR